MQIYERLYRTLSALNTTQDMAAVWCTDEERVMPLGERRQVEINLLGNTPHE